MRNISSVPLFLLFSTSMNAAEIGISIPSTRPSIPLANSTTSLEKIGQCNLDGGYKALQSEWTEYHAKIVPRLRENASLLNTQARFSNSEDPFGRPVVNKSVRTIATLFRTEKLVNILDQLDTPQSLESYLKDPGFQRLFGSEKFASDIVTGKFLEDLKASADPKLKGLSTNPQFLNLISQLKTQLSDPIINGDITFLVKTLKLNLLTTERRQGAKNLLAHFREGGVTPQKISQWLSNPPLISEVPYPPKTVAGDFAKSYRDSVGESVQNFLYKNGAGDLAPPTEKNSFDEHIASKFTNHDSAKITVNGIVRTVGKSELEAIDGVARTIWGEALSCAKSGLPQFEAVAKNIADRSVEVCRVSEKLSEIERQKKEIDTYNSQFLVQVGLKPPQGFKTNPRVNRQALSDYGRTEQQANLHCAAQVISKPLQFSVWNSSRKRTSSVKQLGGTPHPNVPNVQVNILSQQNVGDDAALSRVLCPEKDQHPELWDKARKLAEEVVLDPKGFSEKYQYVPPQEEVFFYTHGPNLPFAREIKISGIRIPGENGKPANVVNLRGKGPASCNQFRLFQPRTLGAYK